jgi:hypothetical protein
MILFWTIALTILGTLFATGSVIGYRMKNAEPGVIALSGLGLTGLGFLALASFGILLFPPGAFLLGLGYGSFIQKRLAAHSE